MRLSTDQVQAIRNAAQRVLGADARISVFGSMALDERKGGDIDLFFETHAALANRAKALCQLSGALTLALGDRKIDIILKDANSPQAPIFDIAKRTGVPL
jgi:predicted nucleotidyltransferase